MRCCVWQQTVTLRCYTVFILFVYTICIYLRYGCKLNSSVLVWFIWSKGLKRVVTEYATDLHCRVLYHLVNEFNTSDYRTAQHWFYECLCPVCMGLSMVLGSWRRMTVRRVFYIAPRQQLNSGGCSDCAVHVRTIYVTD